MKTITRVAWQKPGFAAVEVGEVGIFPLSDDELAEMLADGTLAPAPEEDAAPVAPPTAEGEPVAEGKPHFVGQGEPTPGTWEAEWQASPRAGGGKRGKAEERGGEHGGA